MALKKHNQTILAIDPGTRHLGIAVLDGDTLVHYGVRSIPGSLGPHARLQAGRRIVHRLLRDFRPGLLAIEKAFVSKSRNAALLNVLVDEIHASARARRISVRAFAPSTVKWRIARSGRATKRAVAAAVVLRYPELKPFLGQNRKWKERYHGNMFDAIAVGLVAREVAPRRRAA